jgi:pentatricopeptide repeat protein
MDFFGISPDIWTYNILLGGLCDNGELEKALVIFEDMQKREMDLDIVTYTTVIRGMCKTGKVEEAWSLFCSLSLKGLKPDIVTYTTMMSGLCTKGLLHEVEALYTKMKQEGLMKNDCTLSDGDITLSAELIKKMLSCGYAPSLLKDIKSGVCKKALSLL